MRQFTCLDGDLVSRTYAIGRFFPPKSDQSNVAFAVQRTGPAPFFALATSVLPDFVPGGAGNAASVVARWRYDEHPGSGSLLEFEGGGRVSNISPTALARFRGTLGDDITDDDVFHYVYGILHSPEFRSEFEVNLKKEAPRVPLVTDRFAFDAFAAAGAELIELHIGYENAEPYPLAEEWLGGVGSVDPGSAEARLLVGSKKMKYPKVTDDDPNSETFGEKVTDKSRLVYNEYLTMSGIPSRAHDYVIGARSGIEWIIDRWYVKTDKASGIVNDVNQWGLEQGKPRYIIDLIKRVVTVSLRTVDIVESLPTLRFDEHGTHIVPLEATDPEPI